jgi:hypothetical protein
MTKKWMVRHLKSTGEWIFQVADDERLISPPPDNFSEDEAKPSSDEVPAALM